jgi:hypothetical protein
MRSRWFWRSQRLLDGSKDGVVAEELAGVPQEVGDAPASCLDAFALERIELHVNRWILKLAIL